ncbi:MAG: HDIG domain-containing metalloprotein [Chloroflexota bacterium]
MDNSNAPHTTVRLSAFRLILLAVVGAATFGALTLPESIHPAALPIKAGDVSPRDYTAPRDDTLQSDVLTERLRQAAADAVQPVYSPPDPAISRQQIEKLRAALDFINLTRADASASLEQKRADLASLRDLQPDSQTVDKILALPDARWDAVRLESLSVLERTLRGVIRESDVETARRSVPSLVSLSLSEAEAELVSGLVKPFVVANSLYSPELTEAAKQAARDSVALVEKTYKAGETIVRAGEVVSAEQIEALRSFGLIQSGARPLDLAGDAALALLMAAFTVLYFYRRQRLGFLYDARSLLVMAVTYLLFLFGARLVIPDNVVLPYLYPLAGAGLLMSTLFGIEAGILVSLVTCVLAAYGFGGDLLPYYLFSSLCGVLTLGQGRKFGAFIWAAAAVTGAGLAVLAAYRLPFENLDWLGIAELAGAATLNGFLSAAFALLGQYFLAQTLGLATPLHLLEISRPDFPLLKQFLRDAPGTYQHSLQVANLAEQAAEAIGADPLLTRVGALFHDVGKSANAAFFIENQPPGQSNTHQDMDPERAAAAIIRHITDGVALARKHRLPRRIADFMLEHHGVMLTRYQYNLALQKAGGDASKVDIEKFRYPGPRPRSRETAILMLADGAEARARAEAPQTEEEMRALIRKVVDLVQREGQLDHTTLTLRDLNAIVESFVATLRGAYHARIQYPAAELPPAAEPLNTIPRK